jgi:uncharacterized protein
MDGQQDYIGKGWAFPPEFIKGKGFSNGEVVMATGKEDIDQSLGILLRTSLGERVMLPDYGCNMADFQFDPMNSAMLGFLKDMVSNAILFHEPRIRVQKLELDTSGALEGKLLFRIDYTITGSNSRFNFVYDYYIFESAAKP